jgi:hypothetical protein
VLSQSLTNQEFGSLVMRLMSGMSAFFWRACAWRWRRPTYELEAAEGVRSERSIARAFLRRPARAASKLHKTCIPCASPATHGPPESLTSCHVSIGPMTGSH